MSGPAIDLLALDRDVRRAASRVEQLRGWLAKGSTEARDRARGFDPFDGLRHTSVQATYRSLAELQPSLLDVPLRDGLLRWVYELLHGRIGQELDLAEADALHAIDSRLPPSRAAAVQSAAAAAAREAASSASTRPPDVSLHTYAAALAAIVSAPDASRASGALDRAAELASPVAAVRKEQRERRFEVSRRLGLSTPFALASKGDVALSAQRLLDETEPLAAELLKAARKKTDLSWRPSTMIQASLSREAGDGWPSRITQRFFDEAFKALAPRGVDPGPLPEPLGGASFLRAAARWGFAWRTSGTPRSMPFGIARDPFPAPAYRFGHALAWVTAEPPFQRRVLELPSRLAGGQARLLRSTIFFHARTLAVRALFALEETVTKSRFEELTSRLFGTPLPAPMRDAWPRVRSTDVTELVALLGTRAFVRQLVDRFDEDWFRNPKAGFHLTSLACGPAFDADPIEEGACAALARSFEEALG